MDTWIHWLDVSGSLGLAALLGGILGLEREMKQHHAGLRTHMLVSIGAALFVLGGMEVTLTDPAQISRVLQGVATGVGFIGAGTILKLTGEREIKGLTTAASVWMAAGIGTAAALHLYPLAIIGTVISFVALTFFRWVENHLNLGEPSEE